MIDNLINNCIPIVIICIGLISFVMFRNTYYEAGSFMIVSVGFFILMFNMIVLNSNQQFNNYTYNVSDLNSIIIDEDVGNITFNYLDKDNKFVNKKKTVKYSSNDSKNKKEVKNFEKELNTILKTNKNKNINKKYKISFETNGSIINNLKIKINNSNNK